MFCFSTELALLVLRLREGWDEVGPGTMKLLCPPENTTSRSCGQPTEVGWVLFILQLPYISACCIEAFIEQKQDNLSHG